MSSLLLAVRGCYFVCCWGFGGWWGSNGLDVGNSIMKVWGVNFGCKIELEFIRRIIIHVELMEFVKVNI